MIKPTAPAPQATSSDVLLKLQNIMRKHEVKRPISLDSLALGLGIRSQEMIPLIEELEELGHVKRLMPTTHSRRMTNMGSVTLLTA